MSQARLRTAVAALALVGVAIAGYLTYVHYAGVSITCSTGGCKTVQHSRYAEIFGVPVALLGLLAFAGILASAIRGGIEGRAATLSISLTGVAFAAYLLVVQLAVIGAVCEWCVASDAVTTLIAALALFAAREDVRRPHMR
jgi:uncharacterized membrane protein